MKKIAVMTSGGDAPGMNAGIRAVTRTALQKGLEVVGIYRGYQGMIEGDFIPLDRFRVSNIIQRGGTFLKTARSEEFRTVEGRAKAAAHLKKEGIEALVVIGGDGSFRGAAALHAEHGIQVVGCPGTIDNDLYGTDYTIGYDTAVNTAVQAIDQIRDTADSHNRLFFVEVMGRDAGFIALRTGLASGAESVLVPETTTYIDELITKLEEGRKLKKASAIIIVAEGDDEGGALDIAKKVNEKFDAWETKVTVLGHIQRGGSPTAFDRILASRMGNSAVEALLKGSTNVMIGQRNNEMVEVPFTQASKHHETLNPHLLELVEILS
ncbi:6-phosphofructokinase [Phaeocystidibacter luteus]|uniref:ATP-dependent 6-phosphofructokinase n=2 Tax=Phaeocystidibacter luteus TaxID=911197 RepID=A0A6N6RM98_9FLAO|nr:6-phosphofructokinase [Phaeocystidibacter luteus]KAB2814703.1 6-phosphofructokinase [Phaeocystidibacter luteus]